MYVWQINFNAITEIRDSESVAWRQKKTVN